MKLSHSVQKTVVLVAFIVGLLVILYPFTDGVVLTPSSQELLAKPAQSTEEKPAFTPLQPEGSVERAPAVGRQ